jgi:hypothetical protein
MASPLQVVVGTAASVAIVAATQKAAKASIERSGRPYGQLLDLLTMPFVAYLLAFTGLGLSAAAILIGLVELGIIIGAHRARLGEWHPDGIRWLLEHGGKPQRGEAMPRYRIRVAFQLPAGVSDCEKAITLDADSETDALMRLRVEISQHVPDGAPENLPWRILDVRELLPEGHK